MKISAAFFPFILLLTAGPLFAADLAPPARAFDLRGWKLQIPGPQEFKDLHNYTSGYFFLSGPHEMCFSLDAAEKGTTPNTHYVRSELRHNADWTVDSMHTLSAEVRAVSNLQPDKVTVLQIHGITPDGDNAPPLLRIAVDGGSLMAYVKSDAAGAKTEKVSLKPGLKNAYAKVEVLVNHGKLRITVDGVEKANRDLSYWKFSNYFKAGLYPQATAGTAQVYFRSLKAE
jgi:hypothetical protein